MYWFVLSIITFAVISLTLNLILLFRFKWRQPGRLRRIAQNSAISLISFLVIALLLELFFKLIFAQSDTFGFTLAEENWHKRYVQTNSLGYRDIEWTPDLLAGRTKIMVLGDSFVEGAGINDPANRFADRLGHLLGEKYAIMNVGLGGASTKDEIKNALEYPYRPDIIILSFYLNDIDQTAKDMGFKPPALTSKRPFLVDDSYALNFFYWRLFRLVPQADETYWRWLLSLYQDPAIWDVYQTELLQIHQAAQQQGSRLIVVVFPELLAIEESRPITTKVVDLYRQQGVPVLNVTTLVSDLPPAEIVVNAVDSHPNETIHALVATELYQLVRQNQQANGQQE